MDVFQFYSKSKQVPAGTGAGERLVSGAVYKDLPRDFRQVLSNFSLFPVMFRGSRYPSVEHAFHAAKILSYAPPAHRAELAARFTEDSASFVGLEGAKVKKAGGKHGVFCLSPSQIEHWKGAHSAVMQDLLRSKFMNNDKARSVLLATKSAQLWHYVRAKPPQHWTFLEVLRTELSLAADVAVAIADVVDAAESTELVTLKRKREE